jgi:tRNA nucleotidyltransferase (CCA-adding enzyme)
VEGAMQIILTHEQADFDALASLLGAYLLDDYKVPVLPRRMNRNVRAFLTVYGPELPFVDPRDLEGSPIAGVTLVDTQSLVTIKGMTPDTPVTVIDHHPIRENPPSNWDITTVEIGATTTLLVESLREQNGNLTPIQATLLLLGIYEDTGSLTYTRTTPRDLRAAAYLLEHGASLEVANNFLNHPLSAGQMALYTALLESSEHYHIHGHTIVIARGDASDLDEELSSLAHKMRDFFDPDALFLLVKTRGGVQMIARSNSDQIDVANIVAHFGGGGHERAAAGLIRGRELENVATELIGILPEHVRPAITVAQLMSRGPQVLSPDTTVEEAAQRMRRYGHEGYPVVSDGKVIGLLTRRAVDRALSHKLNLPVTSLMDAGEVVVRPDDSIEHLQRVMTDSGWGQVPVVHPESGEVIGIVTRTDLLKTLAPRAPTPGRQNLASRIRAALPSHRLALLQAIAEEATRQQTALFIVGGFVRDLLLDKPSLDFDLVVEGDAPALARGLAERFGGRVTTHARFGTAKWHLPAEIHIEDQVIRLCDAAQPEEPEQAPAAGSRLVTDCGLRTIDLISARTEFYRYPTALPTVERGSIKLDLHRRDFTINTLAIRLDGSHYGDLHDYWGGLNDLRHGLVRVLHSLSFVDDPTRMLRAVRFEQRFDFQIEKRTLELLLEARPLLNRVSGDRIRHELNHILAEQRAAQILTRLNELGLLAAIHPQLTWDHWLQSRFEVLSAKQPDPDWELGEYKGSLKQDLAYGLWLLRHSEEDAQQICARLKMPVDLTSAVSAACALWRDLPQLAESAPSEVVKRLEDVPALSRFVVYLATSDIHLRKLLQTVTTQWRKITPTVNGNDLKKLGLPPGPAYREILERLRSGWLNGEINSVEEEQALLQELIARYQPEKQDEHRGT